MDYQFREIEKNWQNFWAANKTYKVENNSDKPKYYVLDMFPYPSGAGLHVGHPLGYIASDIFARYKRLKGFNVLHPMGYDSFGLPAEQYAIQTGQHPALTTEANILTYRRQLDQIGFSFDWDREVRTSDPGYYKWTQWIFMQLFNSWYNKGEDKANPIEILIKKFENSGSEDISAVCDDDIGSFSAEEWKLFSEGEKQKELLKYRLTYLKESTVNWCPALGTVLANDEVKDGFSERGGHPVEQKKMMQWSMRITAYADRLLEGLDTIDWPEPLKEMQRNWIGRSVGAMVKFSLTPALSGGEGATKGYQTADPAIWNILKENARVNRKDQTDAEAALWSVLRNSQLGHKIRRQHAIGSYIADFVCLRKGLIVEVDGGYHNSITENDKLRTEALNQLGFEVIRFSNEEALSNTNLIAAKIKEKLNGLPDRKLEDDSSLSSGEGRGEAIEVFTTRVDTLFGVSFLVIAPEHELVEQLTTPEQKQEIRDYIDQTKKKSELDRMADAKTVSGAFTGSYALHPITNEKIPVWIADYVLAGYGTGAVMAVPSGDQRDWLFAKKFNLPIVPILDTQLNLETEADATKEGKYINSGLINGLSYTEAVPKITAELEKLGAGKAKVNFRLRDAIFGRQRYWGEPVPVYFKNGLPYLIDESELPLVLPEVDKYLPTESGEPPLGRATDWTYSSPFGEGREGAYELSTMPGWAGSSWYWYRYMASPEERKENVFAPKEAIEYWKAVDLYIGGSEHATGHLLYSRFWNKFLKDIGYVIEEEPFKKLVNQGMIQGTSEKMYIRTGKAVSFSALPNINIVLGDVDTRRFIISSDFYSTFEGHITKEFYQANVDVNFIRNNVLDVPKYVNSPQGREYRNDVFVCQKGYYLNGEFKEFTDCAPSASDKFKTVSEVEKMSKSKFNVVNPDDLIERYGTDTLRMYEMFLGPLEQAKPWNTNGIEGVFKFLRKFWKLFHNDKFDFTVSDIEPTKAELKALHKIIKKVEEDIERFSFNTSVSSFMIAVNELTDLKCNKRSILQDMVIILQPYAPHVTEELWKLLGNKAGTLSEAKFPEFNADYLVENDFSYPISINGKMKMNLNISLALEPTEIEKIVLENADVQKYLNGKSPKKVIVVKGKIVNLVV